MSARVALFAAAILVLACACATTTTTPLLSDAERCARFGGSWAFNSCRTGAP
jgi:hypothetical protein